MKEIFGLGLD